MQKSKVRERLFDIRATSLHNEVVKTLLTELQTHLLLAHQPAPMLERAFWHNSAVYEKSKEPWQGNERLEFLGDAVLELLVSHWLFRAHPYEPEGSLTALRASLVCEENLAKCAKQIGINRWIILGKGEKADGGSLKPAILADLYEAVLGAIFVDYGLQQAEEFLQRTLLKQVDPKRLKENLNRSWKNLLQEWVQGQNPNTTIAYQTEKSGQDHLPFFQSHVLIDQQIMGEGQGKSKKEAEQRAAKAAYIVLNPQWNPEENADKE